MCSSVLTRGSGTYFQTTRLASQGVFDACFFNVLPFCGLGAGGPLVPPSGTARAAAPRARRRPQETLAVELLTNFKMSFEGADGTDDNETLDAAQYKDSLSHVKATDIFIGLKYWARATRYEPTPGEREILEEGTARSARNSAIGAFAGAGTGASLCYSLKVVQSAQRAALAVTFAWIGSLVGQFMANRPCLSALYDNGAREHSPLAQQAAYLQRFSKGLIATREERDIITRRMHDEQAAKAAVADAAAVPPLPLAPEVDPLQEMLAPEQPVSATTQALTSWAQIRAMREAERDDRQARAVTSSAPVELKPVSVPLGLQPNRRERKNAYGDEII